MKNKITFKNMIMGFFFAEGSTLLFMLLTPIIVLSINKSVTGMFGKPSDIGFGWAMIFGGWLYYVPVVVAILGLISAFFITLVFRTLYDISLFNQIYFLESNFISFMNRHYYVIFLVASWLYFALVPYYFSISFSSRIASIWYGLLMIIDIYGHLFSYYTVKNVGY